MSEERSARDAILAAVREAKPPAVARVDAPSVAPRRSLGGEPSRADAFAAAAAAAGAEIVVCARTDVARVAAAAVEGARAVLSVVDGVASRAVPAGDAHALAALDAFVYESRLGVAENGASWFATSDDRLRAALFLAERVVVVLAEEDLLDDLHAAYARIDFRAHPYGVFVAGPSKTADIEQALVIGAHGPKAYTIVLVRAGGGDGAA